MRAEEASLEAEEEELVERPVHLCTQSLAQEDTSFELRQMSLTVKRS